MHHPLVVIFESGSDLANALRVCGLEHRCVLKEAKAFDDFRSAIAPGSAAIGIVYLDGKPTGWEALAWLSEHRPGVRAIAVLDATIVYDSGFAWDLGVSSVVIADRIASDLSAVIECLLNEVWGESHDTALARGG